MVHFPFLDILLAIVLLWFAWKGLCKGLIIGLVSLTALIMGLLAAFHFSHIAGGILKNMLSFEGDRLQYIAFGTTFLAVVIMVQLLGKTAEKVLTFFIPGIINSIAGALLGMLKAALVISAFFYFLEGTRIQDHLLSAQTRNKSKLYAPVSSLAYYVIPHIEEIYPDQFPGRSSSCPDRLSGDDD